MCPLPHFTCVNPSVPFLTAIRSKDKENRYTAAILLIYFCNNNNFTALKVLLRYTIPGRNKNCHHFVPSSSVCTFAVLLLLTVKN